MADIEKLIQEEKAAADLRRLFLKDKMPIDVLLWMMRAGDLDPRTRAKCAIALLPYMHEAKGDIAAYETSEG